METSIFDKDKAVFTILKAIFQSLPTKIRTCKNYNKLDNLEFGDTLQIISLLVTSGIMLKKFIAIFAWNLDMHANLKERHTPSSHLLFYELGNVQGIYAEYNTT